METATERPEPVIEHPAVSSAAAVAADIRRRMPEAEGARLHKLLYFVQGTHLRWERGPAFDEELEAWRQGPVVACLWHAEAGGQRPRPWAQLPASVHNVITNVLANERESGCTEFFDDIPEPDPWHRVTDGGRNVANQPIPKQLLIEYFDIDSPLLVWLRASVDAELAAAGHDRHRPFVPDPPGALEAFMAEYRAKRAH